MSRSPDHWTNLRLLLLFFAPAFFLIAFMLAPMGLGGLGVEVHYRFIGPLILPIVALVTIGVSIQSALIQMRRQDDGAGTLILFSFVYLIAEIFSLFLTLAALVVVGSLVS